MKKIPRTAKFCCQMNFFSSNYLEIGQHVVLLLINYTVPADQSSNYFASRRCTHHSLKTFKHVFVLSFNVFLFTL